MLIILFIHHQDNRKIVIAFLLDSSFRLGNVSKLGDHSGHYFFCKIFARDLTSPHEQRYLNPISFFKKFSGFICLHHEVMDINVRCQPDLLNMDSMLFFPSFFFFFCLLVTEFTVINGFADRWFSFWGDLNQVQSFVSGITQRFANVDHSDLFTVGSDQTNLLGGYFFINMRVLGKISDNLPWSKSYDSPLRRIATKFISIV